MSGGKLIFLTLLCACAASSGHAPQPSDRPMSGEGYHPLQRDASEIDTVEQEGKTKRDRDSSEGAAPETVLSVHYDRGLIKELYLSQTRGRQTENNTWGPSVQQRRRICEDLCQAGLGGDPCGYSCKAVNPTLKEKQTKKKHHQTSSTSEVTTPQVTEEDEGEIVLPGTPRTDVCPILCANGLGMPLCICDTEVVKRTTWSSVCDAFCSSDPSYQLQGCPACKKTTAPAVSPPQKMSQPSDFWVDWCKAMCKIGEGGAACKCDLAPMSL